jgi:hypothetical protein
MRKRRPHEPGKLEGLYVLQGKLAVPEPDATKWAIWTEQSYANGEHWVARDRIGGVSISTIFLGMDHNFVPGELPILFETMIFRGGASDETFRCGTWEEAEAQHVEAVAMVRQEIKDKVNL